MTVTLYHGDCLEVLKMLEPGSIDAVITDPPYLATDLHFDTALDMEWLTLLLQVVQSNGYLCTFGMEHIQREAEKLWQVRFSGVWLKEKGGMRTHSAKKPRCQQEQFKVYAHPNHTIGGLVWNKVFQPGKPYKMTQHNNGYKRGGKDQLDRSNTNAWTKEGYVSVNYGTREVTDVLYGTTKGAMKHAERTDHPTQKPLSVVETQVLWLTNPGQTVLDPFMGSGTTGVACVQTGRNFIGIEIDRGYFEIAERRIAEAQAQMRMEL